jgi:PKD domain
MKISRLFCVMGILFLATVLGANAATVILVTVSNTPPALEGEPILITGSAMYSAPYYPVSGATTTITLDGVTSNLHTFAGGTYSASMGPLPAGEYTACVHITDTSVEGSNCLAITVGSVKSNQTVSFPAIADQLTTDTVELAATASSGLPVSFAVGSGPASIAGGTNLTFSGAGSVSIVASQGGDGSWNPAPNVTNTFTVTAPVLPLEIITASLPSGMEGEAYSASLAATNGIPPYSWSAGTLPAGLSISSNGVLSGTPTQAGTNPVSFTVQDSVASTTNQSLDIVVKADTNTVSISTALYDRGQPLQTCVVGDVLGDTFEFAVNTDTTGWGAEYGLGTTTDGTDWTWREADWSRMDGVDNRVWISVQHEQQFTSAGTWYYAGRFVNSGETYNVATDWATNSGEPLAAESYFTVNALADPGGVIAEPHFEYPATRASLGWMPADEKNVMVTMSTESPTGSPEQGVNYQNGDTFGNQTVVGDPPLLNGLDVTGLMPDQTYFFTFYSENMACYSGGWTESCTMGLPQVRNTDGGAPEAPAEVFLGDQNLTFGCDSWGTIESNWGRARMWASVDSMPNEFDFGAWGAFTNTENKPCASPPMAFDRTGYWTWGVQIDYGSPYGDDFWYGRDDAFWSEMWDPVSSLLVTVLPLHNPTNMTATPSLFNPETEIELTWTKDPQGHDVMVMRKPTDGTWIDVEYMQGMPFDIGMTFGDATVVDNGPFTSTVATLLEAGTTYDFRFYSVNNNFYSPGVDAQASTGGDSLEIVTLALPSGTAETAYSASLEATNGTPPYTWTSGTLPPGLSCASNGVLSGTPTLAGTNLVTFTVQDSLSATATQALEMVIQAAPVYTGDRYVSLDGGNTPPYSNWVTAAHSIQDAVDVADPGVQVWVSNGLYATGMRAVDGVVTSNRLVIDKVIRVESLYGPDVTLIAGNGESEPHLRGVVLTAGATLSGFTIQDGYADVEIESVTTNGEGIVSYTFVDGIGTNCGGGVLAADLTAVVSNCLFIGNRVIGDGGAFYGGSGFNCTFLSNSAITVDGSSAMDSPTSRGGATRHAALSDCDAMWNSCSHGGAFADGSALRCTLISNTATFTGGGALNTEAEDCKFAWNSAQDGGGLHGGSARHCTFTANGAGWGAGAHSAALVYCHLSENSAYHSGGGSHSGGSTGCVYTANYSVNGGGAWAGIHTHSTFTKNTAQNGILRAAWAYNCLVYDNTASNLAAYDDGEVTSSEAWDGGWKKPWRGTPFYAPGFATEWRLATNALSIGSGNSAYALSVDIDGDPYRSPPTPGADEPQAGSCTGALSVAICPVSTQLFSETETTLTADITGAASRNEWDMGDGTILTNQGIARHSWSAAGTYPVTLRAWNADHPSGVTATASVIVTACPVYYVSPVGQHTYPFNTWAKAATNIQAAINAAPSSGGATVWVGDGTYNAGSQPFLYNGSIESSPTRVVIDKPIRVRSVNGPDVTVIEGQGPMGVDGVRCAYITRDAVLDGFTLTQGHTDTSGAITIFRNGAGIYGELGSTTRNCVIVSNQSDYGSTIIHSDLHDCIIRNNQGKGAHECTLSDCILMENAGGMFGGGAMYGYYIRCSFISNSASTGGGASHGYALNCVFDGNQASGEGGAMNKSYAANCTFVGNQATEGGALMESTADNSIFYNNDAPELKWSNTSDCFFGDPSFVNTTAKNYSLLPESPCINTGTFVYLVSGPLDRRGNSRIQDANLDLGAYEFQGTVLTDADGDGLPDDWELSVGLSPELPNSPAANADGDRLTDWEEYIAMTEPTDPESVFNPPMMAEVDPEGDCLQIGSTSTNRVYDVKYIVDLLLNPQVWTSCGFSRLGNGDVLEFELTNGLPNAIYRIGVSLP